MQVNYRNLSKRVVGITDDIYANMARELHDGIGQHLASMKLQTQLAKLQPKENHLVNIEEELKTSVTGLRRLLARLHPVLVDQYAISDAIHKESQHLEKLYKTQFSLNVGEIKLNKDMELQLFRIFQECTNNAINHGHATKISIQLAQKENTISFNLNDNGIGFDIKNKPTTKNSGGLGFISLHERIDLLNGRLIINSNKDKGTQININIPLTKRAKVSNQTNT